MWAFHIDVAQLGTVDDVMSDRSAAPRGDRDDGGAEELAAARSIARRRRPIDAPDRTTLVLLKVLPH
jgi:hypothetical protein